MPRRILRELRECRPLPLAEHPTSSLSVPLEPYLQDRAQNATQFSRVTEYAPQFLARDRADIVAPASRLAGSFVAVQERFSAVQSSQSFRPRMHRPAPREATGEHVQRCRSDPTK